MSRKLLAVALGAFLLGAGSVWVFFGSRPGTSLPQEEAGATVYYCPMHPSMVSDRPGDCPICQMRLVPMETDVAEGTGGAASSTGRKVVYRSTMNPSETSDKPGKDSMGMEMVPVEVEEPIGGDVPGIAGRASVRLSSVKQQLIGVRTAIVRRAPLVRTIRTVGRVTYDETRLHHVHTKVGGWVERLHADAVGELVRKGEPLLTIYSPELVASAEEYLLALRTRERLEGSTLDSLRDSGQGLVESARRRLLLFDLTSGQIETLEKEGKAPRTITLYSPTTGHVITRNVTQGERIEPGLNLLDIADMERVWVLADIYEYEIPHVRVGQRAVMTLSYLPGRTFEGRVTLVYPVLSEQTRTVKVRLEFANHDLMLKPEMFADVALEVDLGERLVVPESAVISTGDRDVVFVARGEGLFEPRQVKVGARLSDTVEVLDGLADGEEVVASGNFLIDSESRLKSALSEAGGVRNAPAAPSTGEPPPAPPPGHRH